MKTTTKRVTTPNIIFAPKKNLYIEIVASSNPRLNAMSHESQQSILKILKLRYSLVKVTIVDTMADLDDLVMKKPDLVILGMKLILLERSWGYDASPKVWLSSYLKSHNINFTGSDTKALELEYNKHESKQCVIDAGLKSSAYFISPIKNPIFNHKLTFPLFVKPTDRGDSKGIDEKSVVYNQDELITKIKSIHKECTSDALIEEYLPGREFSVAVIRKPGSTKITAMPIEIIAPTDSLGNIFLSEKVKQSDSESVIAVKDIELNEIIKQSSIAMFLALGSRDYGRIDVRLNSDGIPYFIEANLMPGLSEHGYMARCFKLNFDISYQEMILSIIELAEERTAKTIKSSVDITKEKLLLV